MKNKTLFNQLFKALSNKTEYGDERQSIESHKIISTGMLALIILLFIFSIIYDTIDIHFSIPTSVPGLFHFISFIIGLVCFYCGIAFCKRGIIEGSTHSFIIYTGLFFPPFMLSDLIYFIFKGYEKEVAIIALLIIPITIFTSYYILNKIYQKAIYELENEDCGIN
ncbi:hypothetical protein J1C67_10635 [Clostridium gasigenes]|uniref:hypothetical protein n=1 Tax=Clostridium gasigenes TaxID=94869 RepID=UPI00143863DE|nr:hypothetical protein [Clostridium gasigenes]NKF07600.1 hypothetical protein [Clostridium gasigenes]QSW18029.1 hypothetical protein J1C67_10635 [Clostridium gasigenes]